MRDTAMFTTAAKAAVPVPRYNYLNFDEQKSRLASTYDRALIDSSVTEKNMTANANSTNNTLIRNAGALGLSSGQTSNLINDSTGTTISHINDLQSSFLNNRNNLNIIPR